jgi:hypothetical protein
VLIQQGSDISVIIQLPVHHLRDSIGRHPLGQALFDLAHERLKWNTLTLSIAQDIQESAHDRRIELPVIPESQDAVQGRRRNPHFLRLDNRLGETGRPTFTVRPGGSAQQSRNQYNAWETQAISAFHDHSPPSELH